MGLRVLQLPCATLAVFGALGPTAAAAGPPPPTSTNGRQVQQVASGLGTPTSFAFGAGQVFEGDGGNVEAPPGTPQIKGGVYLLSHGHATRLNGSPPFVAGVVWHKGTLYVSDGNQLLAWSGWNGTQFTKRRTIYAAPKRFTGFNGLGFGANGRLYAGVSLASNGDHGPPTTPFAYDFLSFNAKGKDLKIVARGIRQPWQMVFPKGSSSPFVSALGQDKGARNPPDFVLRVRQGDNYGFPKCNWTKPEACKAYAKPFKFFPPHTDVMGLGIIGKNLYMSEFIGDHGNGLVTAMPVTGGKPKTVLKGFVAPIVGLGVQGRWLYVGELTGQVFRVKQ